LAQRKRTPKRSADPMEKGRLRDLAREATRHLDDVLPGDEPDGRAERGGDPAPAGDSVAREARPAAGASHDAGRPRAHSTARDSGGPAKALVAHVIPGMARILAGLLAHSGFEVTVVDDPRGLDSEVRRDRWDIAFVQGTAAPHPGKRIALAALSHCADRGTPIVLVTRRGDPLIAEAAASNAVGLLEWPFSGDKLARILSDVFPRDPAAASGSAARRH
jgi:hypothetical protein